MKEVPANKKKSLGKLPTSVRNKMGYMKNGGMLKKPRPENVKKRTPGGGRILTEQEKFKIKMQRAKARREAMYPDGKMRPSKKFKEGGKVGGAGYTKDKSRSKFAEGYAQGLDTELESNPIKRVINKGMEKFLNKGTTVYKRKGKDKKGYDKGVADAKKAMKIVDRNYLKGK